MMPGLELFENLRMAQRRLSAAEDRVSFCRAAATKATVILGNGYVSQTKDVAAHEKAILRLMSAQKEYADIERQYCDLRDQVCTLLQALPDPLNADILKLHYVNHKPLPTIAKELHLSRSNVYYRHKQALTQIQRFLQKEGRQTKLIKETDSTR